MRFSGVSQGPLGSQSFSGIFAKDSKDVPECEPGGEAEARPLLSFLPSFLPFLSSFSFLSFFLCFLLPGAASASE